MSLPQYPFAALTEKQLKIVKVYEYLRMRPDTQGTPIAQRVAIELNRKLDQNKSNSYVLKVVRKWNVIKREIAASESH